MKVAPCKDCTDRYLACHDYCEKYKEWKLYANDIKHKTEMDKWNYRSTTTSKKSKKDRKKYGGKYMRNKF